MNEQLTLLKVFRFILNSNTMLHWIYKIGKVIPNKGTYKIHKFVPDNVEF